MKAYKLYVLVEKEFIISKDVVFHETIFPFQNCLVQNDQDPFAQIVLPNSFNEDFSLQMTMLVINTEQIPTTNIGFHDNGSHIHTLTNENK